MVLRLRYNTFVLYALGKKLFYDLCLFAFMLSMVKGKNADQNISKKDTAAQKIMSHLLSSSLFEKNDGQYDDPFEYRFTNGNACVDFYKNQVRFSVRTAKTEFNTKRNMYFSVLMTQR